MGKGFKADFDGKKLFKELQKLADRKQAKRIARLAVNAGAQPFLKEARKNVPTETKALKKAQTKKLKQYQGNYTAVIGADATARGPAVNGVERVPANYDHLVENGYQLKNGTHVPGKHYMKNAAIKAGPNAVATTEAKMAKEVVKLIDKTKSLKRKK